MSLKVNGKAYGWGDVDIKLPGLTPEVQEVSYDDENDVEEAYGRGGKPRGYGEGNYKASGKLTMLRDDTRSSSVIASRRASRSTSSSLPRSWFPTPTKARRHTSTSSRRYASPSAATRPRRATRA